MKGILSFLRTLLFFLMFAMICGYLGFTIGYIKGVSDSQKTIDSVIENIGGQNLEFQGKMPW